MFEAQENACHSWDESGMWLVMKSASVFWTSHNLSQDTTLSNLLILAICRTLLANKLSSSANLVLPKTSKMAMIRLQVESSENPIFLHQTPVTYVSDLFFLMWIFWKEEFQMYTQYYNWPSLFNQTESQKLRWEEKDKKFPNPCIWADCSHGRAGPWCPSTAVVLPFNELGSPSVLTLKIKR